MSSEGRASGRPSSLSGSIKVVALSVRPERLEAASCAHENAYLIGSHQHECERSPAICSQAGSPVVKVDPRWRGGRLRMRVPCPEIKSRDRGRCEPPTYRSLMSWIAKCEGEPRGPVARHGSGDRFDPDCTAIDGCRADQHTEGLGGGRLRLPMHTPDARYFLVHGHPPTVSFETAFASRATEITILVM